MSYISEVKRFLRGKKVDVSKVIDEIRKLEDRASDPKFSEKYRKDAFLEANQKRFAIGNMKNGIMDEYMRMENEEKNRLSQLDRIRGDALTDDYKLFNCGVKLSDYEIEGIIDRNSDNPTMIQLALRYADDNGIKVNRVFYGHKAEMMGVSNVRNTVELFVDHWIDKDNAGEMLDKFFPEDAG